MPWLRPLPDGTGRRAVSGGGGRGSFPAKVVYPVTAMALVSLTVAYSQGHYLS